MNYRDDRDALRGKVAELEGQLADARREGEVQGREAAQARAKALEEQIAGVRGTLDRMEAELQALRGGKPKKRTVGSPTLALLLVVAAAAGGAYSLFARTQVQPPPPPLPVEPVTVQMPAAPTPKPEPEPEPKKVEQPPEPEPRSTTARWRATVKRAVGVKVAPGSTCFVDAVIETKKTNTRVPSLKVTCGQEVVYDTAMTFSGVAQMGNDAIERMGPTDDKSTFTLKYTDMGMRSGRPQIDLDTTQREGSVFRDHLPRLRVDLSLPVESEPGAPLAGPEQRMRRAGRLAEVSGFAGLKPDTECILRAMPTGKQEGCVAEVACGKTVLVPAATAATCTYEGARPVKVEVTSGPLQLTMNGASVEVKRDAPRARALLELSP